MSIQVAILKVLSSHGSGGAPLASLNRDIAILTASGAEWSARIRRLASRVPAIDIFGQGYVVRTDDGWEITPAGRDFLAMLEAVTQDNLPQPDEAPAGERRIGARQPHRGRSPLSQQGPSPRDAGPHGQWIRPRPLVFCLSMILSENRCTLFRIML